MSAQEIVMIGNTYEQQITLRNLVRVGQTELIDPVTYDCASWAHPVVSIKSIGMKRRITRLGILKEKIVGYTTDGTEIPSCDISKEAAQQIIRSLIKNFEVDCCDTEDETHVMDVMGFYIARPERMVMQLGKTTPRYFDLAKARETVDSEGHKLFPTPFDFVCHCIFMEQESDVAPYEIFNIGK